MEDGRASQKQPTRRQKIADAGEPDKERAGRSGRASRASGYSDAAQVCGRVMMDQVWNSRVTFKGDEAGISNFQGKAIRGTFRLDPTQQPKQIDVEVKIDVGLPVVVPAGTMKGIYELDGDTLRVCLLWKAAGGKDRPTDFKGATGVGSVPARPEAASRSLSKKVRTSKTRGSACAWLIPRGGR